MTHRWIHSLVLTATFLFLGGSVLADSQGTGAQAGLTIQDDRVTTGDRNPDMDLHAVKDKDLGFRLIGTAVSDDNPERSLAVVEDQATGTQSVYSEGDLAGGLLIKNILYGKVIVATSTGDMVISVNSGGYARNLASEPQAGQLSAEELDAVIPDYMALMQQIRVRSYFAEGRLAGFVIYNIEAGSIFERMGLQNGDVIESVNGKFFATTQPVVEFYDALMESETVTLEVIRDNTRKGLLFNIQ